MILIAWFLMYVITCMYLLFFFGKKIHFSPLKSETPHLYICHWNNSQLFFVCLVTYLQSTPFIFNLIFSIYPFFLLFPFAHYPSVPPHDRGNKTQNVSMEHQRSFNNWPEPTFPTNIYIIPLYKPWWLLAWSSHITCTSTHSHFISIIKEFFLIFSSFSWLSTSFNVNIRSPMRFY